MNEPRHTKAELKSMQSLPLEAKIEMTKARIREGYESWHRIEILNTETGKHRTVTVNADSYYDIEKYIGENEFIESDFNGAVYVSFSGGKDSTVLKHLVDSMYDDVPAVFVNTGLEYPEIQRFVRDVKAGKYDCFNSDVEIMRPEIRFDQVIQKYGYPVISKEVSQSLYEVSRSSEIHNIPKRETRPYIRKFSHEGKYAISGSMFSCKRWDFLLDAPFQASHLCCRVMKKNPAHKYEKQTERKVIVGTMADESILRKNEWLKSGCNAFDNKRARSAPMSFWTEQDVLHYIKEFNVPYCPVYGDIVVKPCSDAVDGQINLIDYLGSYEPEDILTTTGCDRTGCMFCMFGCHLEKEPNRFQRMKETHPNQYKYCMKPVSQGGLGLAEVLDYIGVKYE